MNSPSIDSRVWRPALLVVSLIASGVAPGPAWADTAQRGEGASTLPVVCDEPGLGRVDLGFSRKWLDGPVAYQGILGGETTQGEAVVATPAGEKGRASVYVNLISDLVEPGPSAWSLSIALDGDATLISATIGGTQYPYGSSAVFWMYGVEVVDPAMNGGQQGAVLSALPLRAAFNFPGAITATILQLEIEALVPQAEDDIVAQLRPLDGLRVLGDPLNNSFFISGGPGNFAPCNLDAARATLRFRKTTSTFRRGDANGDGMLDISDPVSVLSHLFTGGPTPPCLEAADANDSSEVDISDAIWTLWFLFCGGPPPRPPFPECGTDPDGDQDGVTCEGSSKDCAG